MLTYLIRSKQWNVKSIILSEKKRSSKSNTPRKMLGSMSNIGVYDNKTLSCNGHSQRIFPN